MSREIMQQALGALEGAMQTQDGWIWDGVDKAIALLRTALEAELAKPEQEPVAYYWRDTKACYWIADIPLEDLANLDVSPLYTAPPRKPWVGLTDTDIETLIYHQGRMLSSLIIETEAKLKEKNGG